MKEREARGEAACREARRGGDNAQQAGPGRDRAAAPGRRRHDRARRRPEEARRRLGAALQEPRRRPEAPLRQCCSAWAAGRAARAITGSAAPTTPADAGYRKQPRRASFLPDDRRAPEAAGPVPAAFSCSAGVVPRGLSCAGRCWTAPPCFATAPRPAGPPRMRLLGRIAQLVEQLTLNQRVQGSNPGAPTTISGARNRLQSDF